MCMGILSACRSVHQVYGVLQRPEGGPASFSVSMRNEWAFLLSCMLRSIADRGHFTRCLCVACFNCISQIAEGILWLIFSFLFPVFHLCIYWWNVWSPLLLIFNCVVCWCFFNKCFVYFRQQSFTCVSSAFFFFSSLWFSIFIPLTSFAEHKF